MLSERDSDRERQRQREIEGDRERGCEGAAGLDSENAVLRRLTRAVGPAMAGGAGLAAEGAPFRSRQPLSAAASGELPPGPLPAGATHTGANLRVATRR